MWVRTELGWRKRRTGDGRGGKNASKGGELWERFVLVCWGTWGWREVCEGVSVQEVTVGRVERDYIVCGGEGIEGLREWIQLGRELGSGGGGGGLGRGAVDGDKLSLSGIGVRPGSVGSRALEERGDEERLERLPALACHVRQRRLEGRLGREQEMRVRTENLRADVKRLHITNPKTENVCKYLIHANAR